MKEKDYIEELLEQNIDALNDNEPMEGHFARFEEKLAKQHRSKRKVTLNVLWKVAAVVVFVFLAGNQLFIYLSPDNSGFFTTKSEHSNVTLASISPEYEEVEFYYTNSINSGIEQWNKLNAEGLISEEEQLMMNEELAEFENRFKSLQADLKTNPGDERVINAMLEYYQAKLSVITIIVDKLEEVKQRKELSFESSSTEV